jgi:N-formylglutamate deformylase
MQAKFLPCRGSVPLLVSMPHMGTEIPADLQGGYTCRARSRSKTPTGTWTGSTTSCRVVGASVLQPRYSRYVIDLNRPPDDTPMYPGASNTELCPTRFFTGDPLYRERAAPRRGSSARAPRSLLAALPRRAAPSWRA